MKIIKIIIQEYNRKFLVEFNSSHIRRNTSESVVVSLVFDNGITGFWRKLPQAVCNR